MGQSEPFSGPSGSHLPHPPFLAERLLIAKAIVRHIVLLVFLGVALTVQLPSGSVAVPSRQPTPLEKNVCLLHAHYFSDCM